MVKSKAMQPWCTDIKHNQCLLPAFLPYNNILPSFLPSFLPSLLTYLLTHSLTRSLAPLLTWCLQCTCLRAYLVTYLLPICLLAYLDIVELPIRVHCGVPVYTVGDILSFVLSCILSSSFLFRSYSLSFFLLRSLTPPLLFLLTFCFSSLYLYWY